MVPCFVLLLLLGFVRDPASKKAETSTKRRWLSVNCVCGAYNVCVIIQVKYQVFLSLLSYLVEHKCNLMDLYSWLCGHPNKPHYGPCPSFRLSVCFPVCPVWLFNSKTKGIVKPELLRTFPKGGVTGVPIFSPKYQKSGLGLPLV